MKKKGTIIALALAMVLALTGCATEVSVPAVRVRMVTRSGEAADHYAGVVVSENTVTVSRDLSRAVAEVCVSVGDEVAEGQLLFHYDTDELNLMLDKQELELDRLEAEIKSKQTQIAEVEKELKKATGDLKTQLNIQLRQLQTELTQAEYDVEDLETEIEQTKKLLLDVEVKSPIHGTVRKIDSTSDHYITIQQTGAFQIRGVLNELNVDAGIKLGAEVVVVSRVDANQVWNGTVTSVDYNNTQTNSYDELYGSYDSLSSSTSYPFYVSLEHTEGLLLGQHVYVRLAGVNEMTENRILMPESYLMGVHYDEETLITSAYVWCVNEEGKLVQAKVILGEFNLDNGCYVILSGLTMDDYVADPANPNCAEGVQADFRTEADFGHSGAGAATQPAITETTAPVEETEAESQEPETTNSGYMEDL